MKGNHVLSGTLLAVLFLDTQPLVRCSRLFFRVFSSHLDCWQHCGATCQMNTHILTLSLDLGLSGPRSRSSTSMTSVISGKHCKLHTGIKTSKSLRRRIATGRIQTRIFRELRVTFSGKLQKRQRLKMTAIESKTNGLGQDIVTIRETA